MISSYVTGTCSIKRDVKDKYGAKTSSVIAEDIEIRVEWKSKVLVTAEGSRQYAKGKCYFNAEEDVRLGDKIVIDGRDYMALTLDKRTDFQVDHLEVYLG